jgi:CDP-6-deoxy-D-xylo-4-hexulose-3-dehydrase
MINLVKDTIDKNDINNLITWLKDFPKLTKGDVTINFEKIWSEYTGVKYSVFVNSGSSANLAMAYALQLSGKLKNNIILAPAVSWVTTVSPFMQLGYDVKLFDCDADTLGVDVVHLEKLIKLYKPAAMIFVHVLGFPNKMNEIQKLCNDNDVILLEDSCESVGSTYNDIKTGAFGLMSSFSMFFGHHISTIEGGMICTNDDDLYNILKSIRAHGWNRDLDENYVKKLEDKYKVNDFKNLYTFYYPGFNLRSTDLQAYIGLSQMTKIKSVVKKRNENFNLYHDNIKNEYWKIKSLDNTFVSNFAYPIITPKINELVQSLKDNQIETRPLICGSIANQPFWKDRYGESNDCKMADIVDNFGLYLPNNYQITKNEILFVCDVVNSILN